VTDFGSTITSTSSPQGYHVRDEEIVTAGGFSLGAGVDSDGRRSCRW
jgi:hypothetical protein